MKDIELYVHSGKDTEPALLTIGAHTLVGDLVKKIHDAGHCDGAVEEAMLFLEDQDEPLAKDRSVEQSGMKNRHHVHCHKCHRVRVVVRYNGVDKTEAFPPSAKVKRVLKWALDEFQLKGADAENKVLRLSDPPQTELTNDAHIGSFVSSPRCELNLCLVPPVRFQG